MPSTRSDLAGLALLGLLTALPLPWLLDRGPAVWPVWAVGYAALAALSVFAWRSERWPASAAAALKLAAAAAGAGLLVFTLAALVLRWRHPELGFVAAGLRGGPALALALALCPGLVLIALTGAVRNHLAQGKDTEDAA